ncbi:winged helix-turn-helix domain-containing protein [Streptomyces sp. 058-1L]|uniref:winged helix-turn-helix domain-containing protein n=1 Tax=Streptomyces sp. 058-1L TaxID=2789266 RepID=UPI00397F9695
MKTVIGQRFHLTYTVQGVIKLLVRNGWSCQVPGRRGGSRVGQGGMAPHGRLAAALGTWLVFELRREAL